MAKKVKHDPTAFNFGANVTRRKSSGGKGRRGGGRKSDAWRAYVGKKG
jgi:hypothetical protein